MCVCVSLLWCVQVFLDNVPLGLVVINVLGVSVSAKGGPQPYALAVVGKFSGTLASAANPAYNSVRALCLLCTHTHTHTHTHTDTHSVGLRSMYTCARTYAQARSLCGSLRGC